MGCETAELVTKTYSLKHFHSVSNCHFSLYDGVDSTNMEFSLN